MKQKLFTLLTLLLAVCSGAWAETETIKTVTKDTEYSGTCVVIAGNHFAQDQSNVDYIKMRTGNNSNTWVISVKSGCKVTGIRIVGYSNNSEATISMTSLKTNGTEQLDASVVFPVSGTASASYADISKSGFEVVGSQTIVCTFDNSNITGDTNKKNKQIMAAITLTYELDGVAAPTITQTGNSVTMTCATGGADIYYTTDGSTPTSESTAYSAPFTLDNPCTVRAIAIKDEDESGVTDKDCYFTPTGAMALLKFTSGAIDDEDAYLWTSTDGDYALRDNNTAQTNKYTSLEAGNDAFKLSHVDGYTLTPSEDIKITKIAFIGKSLYEGYTGTVRVTGFNSDAVSSFIEYPTDGQKYLSTIEFTPDEELTYGAAVNFNPGGCESAAYIVIYGVKRSGPADPQSAAGDPITWDFTNLTAQAFENNKTYSFKATDGTTEMRYTAGSSDAIVAKSGSTAGYLKTNGKTGSGSAKDVDGTTAIAKNRIIRLFVTGKGTLTINCTTNVGKHSIYDCNAAKTAVSGDALVTNYEANTTTSKLTVTNGLWIEITDSKDYINSIVWTPSSDDITLTTTDNMAGWRSFYDATNEYSVDANTKVYVADADPVGTTITLKEISGIPDGVPVILHTSSSADSYKMTLTKVTDGTYTYTGDNKLQYTTSAVSDKYRLGYGTEGIGFYPYSGTPSSGAVILDVSSASARALTFAFDDNETTGINEVQGSSTSEAAEPSATFKVQGDFYDLQGRRVAQPTKGLYIVNGRKVTIK